eukprot:gene17872-biopygen14439
MNVFSAPHQALALMWCCSSFEVGWVGGGCHAPGARGGVRPILGHTATAHAVQRFPPLNGSQEGGGSSVGRRTTLLPPAPSAIVRQMGNIDFYAAI